MNFWAFVLPVCAAVAYVTAALFIKRAAELGADVWRTAFVCNVAIAICFQCLLLRGGTFKPLAEWWQPALVALLFLSGQIWTFVALSRGDVSVATPVLGLKIIMVAALSAFLLTKPVSAKMWLSAALATAGVMLLNFSGKRQDAGYRRNIGFTIVTAGLAGLSYAVFDVLIQQWSPEWGIGRFLPVALGLVGIYSFALIPFFKAPLLALPPFVWRPLAGAALFMSIQTTLFVSTIALFHNAAAANVIYSVRGLLSIAAVWLLGHWFANEEKAQGAAAFAPRLCGAALMFVAVVLVLIRVF
jgi:drug/metabolite transporter (DMT)-like permease